MAARFAQIPVLPLDEAFAVTAEFKADAFPQKVSLGAGVYRDEGGKPWVLPSVKKAKEKLHQTPNLDHEYLPIQGSDPFLQLARDLVFGDSSLPSSNSSSNSSSSPSPGSGSGSRSKDNTKPQTKNVISFQTISGTGANHLGAQFLAQHLRPKHVFISDPTWANHHLVWTVAAPDVVQKTYPYYHPASRSLDFDGWLTTLENEAVENDVVILHACAHNPTGIDPTREQWEVLAQLFKRKRLFAFFDSAYQGFATGDLDMDAWAMRHFQTVLFGSGPEPKTETKTKTESETESSATAGNDDEVVVNVQSSTQHQQGHPGLCIAQSFAKNFGLYGERVGAFHLSLPLSVSPAGAYSQLLRLTRAEISNPPLFGARIVQTVLSDVDLRAQWQQDLQTMSLRIRSVRGLLRKAIEQQQQQQQQHQQQQQSSSGSVATAITDWSHLESQIGMFSYTGLTVPQVQRLKEVHHVYLMRNGRASLSGVNEHNVHYVAAAIAEVVAQPIDANE
ncbi:hypothetical protein A1O3_08428 [Capronia epimyces CBS 606.96]|uniref:Aspartate aminotransferase n=1 Tax=Capronia epimyces CBS 606.96 TaxID=1182542 RepID=W9XFF2_9EURO|nr:uncharacterized protein A1O3_08428 [Capronia epimyces CBS 606.96]EXJ78928.1 hypothetical protein A1O3_08428 [Capronia epimyces CBS 606.96]